MRTFCLREHETLLVGTGEYQLTISEVEALDKAQRAMKTEVFRWSGRNSIKATHYVGMLTTSLVRLEILPKIAGLGKGETRRTLIRMICIAWDVPVRDGEIAEHDVQNRDLLELLIGLFAKRLQEQVRAGLSRCYERRADDLSRLRGKLDTVRQFTALAATPQKLACRYDEFTADTALNRLLLCAVTVLRRNAMRADTQRLLHEIAAHFEDVRLVQPDEALRGRIGIDRSNQRWAILTTLARLLLSSVFQTTHGGEEDGISLLFDMNRLFEAYVAHLVKKIYAPLGFTVHTQGPGGCLAHDEAGKAAFRTMPDIYIERKGCVTLLDTKWKRLCSKNSYRDVAIGDVQQMYGYAHVYNSKTVIMLYPHHAEIGEVPGFQMSWNLQLSGSALKIATFDVTKPDGLKGILGVLLEAI
jgi:5-methylcytosine-specific restriction enzyme subunit McrC